jgi:hypothetical protein
VCAVIGRLLSIKESRAFASFHFVGLRVTTACFDARKAGIVRVDCDEKGCADLSVGVPANW